jgi:hypothetical protein
MKSIAVLLWGLTLWAGLATRAQAQIEVRLAKQTLFSPKQMNALWDRFATDQAWQVVAQEAKQRGLARVRDEKAAWGFEGTTTDGQEVLICLYDLAGKEAKGGTRATVVWAKVGKAVYKAIIVLDSDKDFDQAVEKSLELYVDKNQKLQKANSFGRCLRRRLRDQCGVTCLASAVGCAIVPGLAGHVACFAAICGGCATIAALSCGIQI